MSKPSQRLSHSVCRLALLTSIVASLIATSGCTHDVRASIPLAHVDLDRMYGGWYIVATIPNSLERGMVGAYDVFSSGDQPEWIREDFYMQQGSFAKPKKHYTGGIKVLPQTNNADWRVRPFWPLLVPFQIYYTDPEYRFVLFGEQNHDLGWIYSRTQMISDADYEGLLLRFKDMGYDTTRFRKVIQAPEQVGQPGFWSDRVKRPKP